MSQGWLLLRGRVELLLERRHLLRRRLVLLGQGRRELLERRRVGRGLVVVRVGLLVELLVELLVLRARRRFGEDRDVWDGGLGLVGGRDGGVRALE